MYESFYQLNSNPFRLAPDPKFCFSHPSYDKAKVYLEYALNLSEGFVIVTGRPGTGKTTLINAYLHSLKVSPVVAAKVAVPNLNADDLLRAVAYAYEIDVEGMDMASTLRRLEQFFIQQVRARKRILLIIDEAQGLSRSALEELRMLADMQIESRFLVQIFLVGQEKLLEHMIESEMEQFQQRVTGTCKLEPLDLQQTRDYVEFRLCKVGWSGDPEMTGSAVHAIYQYSNGIPRHINKMCARLLLLQGMVGNKHILDEADVLEVAQGFKDEQLAPIQSAQTMHNDAVGNVGAVAPVAPITAYADLALRAPTKKRSRRSSGPAKPDLPNRVESSSRSPLVSEHRKPRREHKKYNAQWIPATVIGGSFGLGFTLLLTMSFYEGNQGDINDLWTLLGGAYESDRVYEYPVYEEHGGMAVQQQHTADSALLGETEQIPVDHSASVAVLASEQEKVEPITNVRPIAESTFVADFKQSTSSNAGNEAVVSVASLELPDVTESEPIELKPAQLQPGTTPEDEHNVVTDNYEPLMVLASLDASAGTAGTVDTSSVTEMTVAEESGSESRSVVVRNSREEKVAHLLSLAGESLQENRLLIPADNNAYAYYLQVKALDPDNIAAETGLDRIAERYIQLAEQAIDRDDIELANRYIERGLRVDAANGNLLALQTAMLPVPPERKPPVSRQEVQELPLESQTLLSRLKEIFNNNQPEISAPSIWHDEENTW